MDRVLDLRFGESGETRVPFVQIGVSGILYVGPNEDIATLTKFPNGESCIHYRPRPDKPGLFYGLNAELIVNAAQRARTLFEQYQEEDAQRLAQELPFVYTC